MAWPPELTACTTREARGVPHAAGRSLASWASRRRRRCASSSDPANRVDINRSQIQWRSVLQFTWKPLEASQISLQPEFGPQRHPEGASMPDQSIGERQSSNPVPLSKSLPRSTIQRDSALSYFFRADFPQRLHISISTGHKNLEPLISRCRHRAEWHFCFHNILQ